jgi:hypothetical protein
MAETPAGTVRLRLVNSAGVSQAELLRAETAVEYIFSKAGVGVAWQDCSGEGGECASPVEPAEFWLHVATRKPAVASSESLGYTAIGRDPGDEGMAGVYYPMVRSLAADLRVEDSSILGPVMAHEIGHLMGVGHSPTGIMCAHFGGKQFVRNAEGGLLFTVAEAAQIRAEIARLKAASPFAPKIQGAKMQIEGGRPVVDGVFVNGQGPYRFLIDTGTTVNLIETGLARKIGLHATSQVELTSSTGRSSVVESDGNAVTLGSASADRQKFIVMGLDAVHHLDPDIRGVLGQWFLARFDYTLDLKTKRLEFGAQAATGARTGFTVVNGRPVIPTSLGGLVLDSGAAQLVLFGVEPERAIDARLLTSTGSGAIGSASRKLVIGERKVWQGDAVTMSSRIEGGVDGLLPLRLFRSVYVSNSENYVVLE